MLSEIPYPPTSRSYATLLGNDANTIMEEDIITIINDGEGLAFCSNERD